MTFNEDAQAAEELFARIAASGEVLLELLPSPLADEVDRLLVRVYAAFCAAPELRNEIDAVLTKVTRAFLETVTRAALAAQPLETRRAVAAARNGNVTPAAELALVIARGFELDRPLRSELRQAIAEWSLATLIATGLDCLPPSLDGATALAASADNLAESGAALDAAADDLRNATRH
jgi:hypothetical protein